MPHVIQLLLFAQIIFLFLIYIYNSANSALGKLASDWIKRSGVRNSIKMLTVLVRKDIQSLKCYTRPASLVQGKCVVVSHTLYQYDCACET